MKVGDIVKYSGATNQQAGLVLYVHEDAGTLKVFSSGRIKWFVISGCEVISESR